MRIRLMASTMISTAALALIASPALGQTTLSGPAENAVEDNGTTTDDVVTVTATRMEQRADEVPETVSVISDKTIENELATDIKDLIRFEPGVSVRNSPGRFGAALGSTGRDRNAGFNIRGLEGNRVLIQVDGVRVPDSYAFGPTVNGRGDYVDLDLLKSVEIIRGPASALYGSDGVAGAVSFITRDPEDLVQDGRNFGVRARSAYASADDSWANSIITATTAGDFSAMLAYTRRDANEQENMGALDVNGPMRTTPNPSEFESDAYLAKIVWTPGDMHRFRLTYDMVESLATSDVLSGRTATVLELLGIDSTDRTRVSFDHEMDLGDGLLRAAKWGVYTQESNTRQFTFEDRTPAVDRTRDNYFDNDVWGASGQLEMAFDTGWASHRLLAGADYSELEQSGIRSGTVPTPPDVFPTRAFPLTEYTVTGAFLQDQISLLDGTLTLHPVLRYDSYELNPIADPLYPTTVPISPSDGSKFTPRFGIVAWPTDWVGAFFNYAQGYKAPEPSQVNNAFSNLAFGYTSLPNPDLKPEESESWEAGIRSRNVGLFGGQASGEVLAFVADHDNFISQQIVSGAGSPVDPFVYQYINLTAVSIHGVEAKANVTWHNGFGLRFAGSYSEGDVRGTPNSPLQSIDPTKLVGGVTFDDPAGVFGGQLIVTHVKGKKDSRVAQNIDLLPSGALNPANDLFTPDAFTTLDLTAYWNVTDWAALRVGAFNLTDEKYWWWGDVRGVGATSAVLDAYTQPGANYSASLTLKY
jgi:hemoglobin/transferrin/lactoferrin receptor protein